ncbi:hypothetical protein NB689_002187 [Xanthomonas sacchari]|nr:hypothetical protein [Xanthomonas sacchari]MCW0449671.1 hypothetical protein [Xanthomonas sacchari]MCW0466094.1 hypothetical protein [Xanthomonas sacchari]
MYTTSDTAITAVAYQTKVVTWPVFSEAWYSNGAVPPKAELASA